MFCTVFDNARPVTLGVGLFHESRCVNRRRQNCSHTTYARRWILDLSRRLFSKDFGPGNPRSAFRRNLGKEMIQGTDRQMNEHETGPPPGVVLGGGKNR
jgi:hypothetical protein